MNLFFDKLVIALVSPLGTALLLWLVALGLWCLARARFRSVAWALAALAWLWLLVWSLPVASHALRAQVEGGFPPLALAQVPQAQAIVLLGGGMRPAERAGPMPDLRDAADRVWLAARLYKAGKAPQVLVSGGSDRAVYATSEAQAMRELLLDMGVPDAALLLEEDSRNTRENALFSARLLTGAVSDRDGVTGSYRGQRPLPQEIAPTEDRFHRRLLPQETAPTGGKVLLVTSALHMRRAQALFETQGLEVVPVPADHEARHRFAAVDWLPDADALGGSARAMKELVGRWVGR